MEIVALSGFARTGKDEVAKVLVDQYGFQRVAFADKLRDMLYALNPIVSVTSPDSSAKINNYVYLKEVINEVGWSGYKETKFGHEIRRLLQRLGTEAGRQTLWDSIWIDATLTNLDEDARVVVADGRFFNEFDAVIARGGEIWRVERPGVGPLNDHASENEATNYPHFALTINNDGTLEDLAEKVRIAYLGD